MASRSRLIVAAWGLALGCGPAGQAQAQTPGFHLVGSSPGDTFSRLMGLSSDGRVGVGFSVLRGSNVAPGFIWTDGLGRRDFGLEPGLPRQTIANAVSGDGSTVVGDTGVFGRAFRYQGPGTYQDLGLLSGYSQAFATGVSGDGTVVAGYVKNPQLSSTQPFRWTPQGGMQGLGFTRGWHTEGGVGGVSRDGTTLVGFSSDGLVSHDPFVWRAGTGMQILPFVSGATQATAWGVNGDGSVIVGRWELPITSAAMWRNGVAIDLGSPSGWDNSTALAVSDSGDVAVGFASMGGFATAAVWTPQHGAEELATYFARNGVPVPEGWELRQATSISADGMTIGGWIDLPGVTQMGFVATIPTPGCASIAIAAVCLARRRRTQKPRL